MKTYCVVEVQLHSFLISVLKSEYKDWRRGLREPCRKWSSVWVSVVRQNWDTFILVKEHK
jgi:hypothetical protein